MVYLVFFLAGGWDGAYPCHMDTFFHFLKIRLNTCDAILQMLMILNTKNIAVKPDETGP